jgi:polysaccharide biosynthesis transport protein
MEQPGSSVKTSRNKSSSSQNSQAQVPLEHYGRVIFHRKWLVIAVFFAVTVGTIVFSTTLPDVYTSDTVIMVDPQKVPDSYVKSTVTGDVRNRLGTLSQQILSATRLQKIIDSLNLYPEDRKTLPREELIARMRRDISVNVLSDFSESGAADLQAFRITYSGKQPKLVAQVANELASLFIEENLKAREQQATGTTEFLQNQLQETRKVLETLETKLKTFKMKHIGEMPEQQAASLQILGQLQSQLQMESEALNRAEQQKQYLHSMMAASTAPVVDTDSIEPAAAKPPAASPQAPRSNLSVNKERLITLMTRYSDDHPEVRRLKRQIFDEEARLAKDNPQTVATVQAPPAPEPEATQVKRASPRAARTSNPVLESQLRTVEAEIAKRKDEQQRISRQVAQYQSRLEAVPVREQEITELVRDYEISKAHYRQLLEKQLSAETATELEIRQKGERFTVLDPAQPADKPSRPNRMIINAAGAISGLGLGLLLALVTEFLGMSVTSPDQISATTGLAVLEVIPVIRTHTDRLAMRRRMVLAGASVGVLGLACCAVVLYHYRDRLF